MKKVFILKTKNLKTNEVKELSLLAFKDYRTAVGTLQYKLINARYELMKEKYNEKTDMTEILKGVIEVYETKKGQYCEIAGKEPIKAYNYNF